MSTHIVYDLKIARIPAGIFDTQRDLFCLMILSGSSNTYDGWGKSAKRVRDWGLIYCGDVDELIAYAIDWSRSFNDGMTVWKSMGRTGAISAQQWIGKIRRSISNAIDIEIRGDNKTQARAGKLIISGKDEFEGKPVEVIVAAIIDFTRRKPGLATWQFMRINGNIY